MKALLTVLMALSIFHANGQKAPLKFSIDLSSNEDYNQEYIVELKEKFQLQLQNLGANSSFYIIVDETKHEITQDIFEQEWQLDKPGKLELQLIADSKEWKITIKTSDQIGSNPNFAFVSLIKSIDGEKAENELFDAFVKFNFRFNPLGWLFKTDQYGKPVNAFSMAGVEFNFSAADSTSSTNTLKEANASMNFLLMSKEMLQNISEYKRGWFLGAGTKVFDERLYVGVHTGALEFGGPFVTTYLLSGFYHDVYASPTTDPTTEDELANPRQFRNNIYTEFAISAQGADIPILSSIRIKVGLLYPFRGKKDGHNLGPYKKDVKHRIVLEVPIDEILKF